MPNPRTTVLRDVLSLAPAHRFRAVAPCVLRVVAGSVIAVHGLDKLIDGPAGFGAYLASLGTPAPSALGWAVALGETLGGLLLVVGLFSRLVSVLLSLHLLGAIVLVNAETGFLTPQQGPASGAGAEFPLLLIAGFVAVLLAGPGPFAVDRVVGLERPDVAPTSPVLASGVAPSSATGGERRTSMRPAVRASLISGVLGGVIGAVMSALANYLVVGMPASAEANMGNHAVSGLISGFLAGFLGLLMHQRGKGGQRPDHEVPQVPVVRQTESTPMLEA